MLTEAEKREIAQQVASDLAVAFGPALQELHDLVASLKADLHLLHDARGNVAVRAEAQAVDARYRRNLGGAAGVKNAALVLTEWRG